MFRGFPDLKALGDKLGESVREFEASLTQPIGATSGGSNATKSTAGAAQRSHSSSSNDAAGTREQPNSSPSRQSSTSSSTTAQQPLSSSPRSSIDIAKSAASATQSASQLADSALSSLRMSLRKGRQSIETAAASSSTTTAPSRKTASSSAGPSVPSPLKKEQELMPVVTAPPPAPEQPEPKQIGSASTNETEEPEKQHEQSKEHESTTVDDSIPIPVEPESTIEPIVQSQPPDPLPTMVPSDPLSHASPEVEQVKNATIAGAAEESREHSETVQNLAPASQTNEAPSVEAEATPEITLDVVEEQVQPPQDAPHEASTEETPVNQVAEEQIESQPDRAIAVVETPAIVAPALDETTINEPSISVPAPSTTAPESLGDKQPSVAVSTSAVQDTMQALERLHALKQSLDKVVLELMGLSSVDDVAAFEGHLRNLKGKSDVRLSVLWRF